MPVNTTHPDYDYSSTAWARARDVLAGQDAIKAGDTLYLPQLASQNDDEYQEYKDRAVFFNATARTLSGHVGLIFRNPPYLRLPGLDQTLNHQPSTINRLAKAMAEFNNDTDMLGTSLYGYAKQVVSEIISVGRCGTLIDWESDMENRAYASLYRAEQILNWRVERVNGRNITTMVVLHEPEGGERHGTDLFDSAPGEQIRVLRLELIPVPDTALQTNELRCVVDLWRPKKTPSSKLHAPRSSTPSQPSTINSLSTIN